VSPDERIERILLIGVGNTFRLLMGDTAIDDPIGPAPWNEPDVSDLLARLKKIHKL